MVMSGLSRGFSTCCLRFTNGVATTHARLASGWLARLYREGVEPSGSPWKVSDHILIILPPWTFPGATSGTFSETKRQTGLLRMLQAGVIVSDYAMLMVEILKDNGRPEAGEVYTAMDMGWATLVGQIARAYGQQAD